MFQTKKPFDNKANMKEKDKTLIIIDTMKPSYIIEFRLFIMRQMNNNFILMRALFIF